MSNVVRRSVTVSLAVCLVVGAGEVTAQDPTPPPTAAVPTPAPASEEVPLCPVPVQDGSTATVSDRTTTTRIAARRGAHIVPIGDAGPLDPLLGCRFPTGSVTDPFTGQQRDAIVFDDVGLPGVIEDVLVFDAELTRRDLRGISREGGSEAVGNLRPGSYHGFIIDHDEVAADVGINLFTTFDGRPFNDAPIGPGAPDSPLAGVEGGYSVFAGDPIRLFVTDFRDGGRYYEGNVRQLPFAAMMRPTQTAFLIPDDGVGPIVRPFVFTGDAFHYIDPLPNGALPVDGLVDLFPECGPTQDVVHQPLIVAGDPISASTDWVSACFGVPGGFLDLIAGSFRGAEPVEVGVGSVSYDPEADEAREQRAVADVALRDGRLSVRFPSGLLRYGYHRIDGITFDPSENASLDRLLASAGATLDSYLVPIAVSASEGLMQGRDAACEPPGAQVSDLAG